MQLRTREPLRCQCKSKHLLAFYGVNGKGDPYVHVMSHRQGRPLSNVLILGDCEIQCPRCYRWHILTFRAGGRLDREQTLEPPAEIALADVVEPTKST